MAIWDNATVSVNCPTCGDSLSFDSAIRASVCRSCGNVYEPGTLNCTGKFKFVDVEEASEEEENKREYVCGSCGAVVVTNENTAVTHCAFCGSPSLICRRLSREFRPDYVIPFKVSEEEAEKKLMEWIKSHKFVPSAFKKKNKIIGKPTGLYVPFWLMDAECHALVEGLGFSQDSSTERAVFDFTREFLFKVKRVPFDGCIGISNMLMSSIEPFDYEELVPYDDVYLPGYSAYRYDRNALQLTDVIDIRLSMFARQAAEIFLKTGSMAGSSKYNDAVANTSESYIKNLSQSYALMPVWFFTSKYKGETYEFAVNGQTGLAGGDLPQSNVRKWLYIIKKAGPWLLGLIALGLLAFWALTAFTYRGARLMITIFGGFVIGAVGIIRREMLRAFSTADEESNTYLKPASKVEDYFDYSYTTRLVDKKDKFVGIQKRVGTDDGKNSEWTWIH